jgi:hypothetical protein
VKVIVSLTSYPARIGMVHLVIESLLRQSFLPDKIVLYLAEPQFPSRTIPEVLRKAAQESGGRFEIRWCGRDIKSYKKLIPALCDFPDDVVITVDDDIIYDKDCMKTLICFHRQHPCVIAAHRVTRMAVNKRGAFSILPRGLYTQSGKERRYREALRAPSFFNKLTGCGGVLYPPHCLHSDCLREDLFMSLAPTSDDIWFWFMGILNRTRVAVPGNHHLDLNEIADSQATSLTAVNDHGGKLFFTHLKSVVKRYPVLCEIMAEDAESNERLAREMKREVVRRALLFARKLTPRNLARHIKMGF